MSGTDEKGRASGPVYFTTHQVAGLLGVSLPTVVNWHKSGRIRAHRTPGGHRRIARDEILRFARHYGYPLPAEFEGAGAGPACIVVVDGERDFSDMVAEFLQLKGAYVVHTADSPFMAGFLVGSLDVRLIVIDAGLPGLDLLSVARKLRTERPELRIAVTTSLPDPSLDQRVRQGLLDLVLHKPLALDVLLRAVKDVLANPPGTPLR